MLHPSPADVVAGLEKNPSAEADVTVEEDAPDVTVAEPVAPKTFTFKSVSCSDRIWVRRCFSVANDFGHSVQR